MAVRDLKKVVDRFEGRVRSGVIKALDRSYFEGAAIAAKEIGSGVPVFDRPDNSMSATKKDEVLASLERFDKNLLDALKGRLNEEGITTEEAVRTALTKPITAIGREGGEFHISPKSYLNMLAKTAPYSMKVAGYSENAIAQGSTGWIWIAEPDACDDCLEKHGQHFEWGDPMPPDDSHANCRCFPKAKYDDEVNNVEEEE